MELEDFDLGLESAGDQGDDSFGELQRIWGFSDCCVFVINGGFRGKFILAVTLINQMVHGLNFFDILTVRLRWQIYVRILMNVQFENCKWNTWLAFKELICQSIKFHRVGSEVQNFSSVLQEHWKLKLELPR